MVKPWLIVLTQFHRAPIFGRISLAVGLLGAYAVLVVVIDRLALGDFINIHATFHALLGLVLGMLLVFRTNTAYERWWEGRKLWGQLVNDSRNLAIKVQTCVQADEAEKQDLARHLIAFAYALKEHLRRGVKLQDLDTFQAHEAQPAHVPVWLVKGIFERLEDWRQRELLGGFELLFLDRQASGLLDVCGGCERIRRTPLAKSYRWFVRQLIAVYLITLPWGLIEDFGVWTVPTVVLIGYFMIGIETIAADIEEPFGTDADDLRLDDLCRGIDASVREIMTAQQDVRD
jgi:ion channel-forming bestrophin family protein